MFEKAWYIGSFAKIPVKIHWSFLLILVFVAGSSASQGADTLSILIELCFLLTMFLCVVLHEFGHALTAKMYGIKTEDIILLPIGGVARLRQMPEKPLQELVIAVMGPAVNVVIATILFALLYSKFGPAYFNLAQLEQLGFSNWTGFLPLLMISNVLLVVFNMIPAFPMDGGRVLRALLSMGFGRLKATRVASFIGQAICIVFIIGGLYYEAYTLSIIGVFIFLGASQEYRSVAMDMALKGKTIRDCYRKDYQNLTEYTTVADAFQYMLHYNYHYFPVINLYGHCIGWVSSRQIQKVYKQQPQLRIGDICSKNILSLHPDTSLLSAMTSLQGAYEMILVVEHDQIIGILDRQSIQNYMDLIR